MNQLLLFSRFLVQGTKGKINGFFRLLRSVDLIASVEQAVIFVVKHLKATHRQIGVCPRPRQGQQGGILAVGGNIGGSIDIQPSAPVQDLPIDDAIARAQVA